MARAGAHDTAWPGRTAARVLPLLLAGALVAPAAASAASTLAGALAQGAPAKCAPAPCGFVAGSGSRPASLANSPHHETTISPPHVVRVGGRLTVTLTLAKASGPRPAAISPPCSDNVAFARRVGSPKTGPSSITCTYRALGLTGGYMAHDFTASSIPDQDYYAIVADDEFELGGTVTVNGKPPVRPVKLLIRGAAGSRSARTGPDGRYGTVLKKGRWKVTPLGVAGVKPSSRTVNLRRDERKVDFAVREAAPKVEWAMVDRAGVDENADLMIDYLTLAQQVDPARWTVRFTVASPEGKPCDEGAVYRFKVDGRRAKVTQRQGPCVFDLDAFRQQRQYTVQVTARKDGKDSQARKLKVRVRDFLIAVLGDSVASGEGNPDLPGIGTRWQDPQCDRSAFAFGPQTAIRIERKDPHTSVTLVHLACSGGQVNNGILREFEGIHPTGVPKDPQLLELRRLVRDREIDALVMSAGANDVLFGPVAERCIIPQAQTCFEAPYPDPSSGKSLNEAVAARLAELPGRYATLADAFAKLAPLVSPRRVYVTEYFDPTRAFNGEDFCAGYAGFDATEFRWAYETIVLGLNLRIRRATQRFGWTAVRGIAEGFGRHGICFEPPTRFIRTLEESNQMQFARGVPDPSGTLHPNQAGHQAIADLVEKKVRADLYSDGKPRKLKP